MNVIEDPTRPIGVADEIAWDSEPPWTLRDAVSFIRRRLTPEQVFSEAELAGCENWRRFEELEDRLYDLGRELDDAELAEQDAHAEADRLRDELAEKDRQIEQLRQELGAQNTVPASPPAPPVVEATT